MLGESPDFKIMEKKQYSIEIGGKTLFAEFNDLANQAHGSVILRYGNTTVLGTAVMSSKAKEGQGYFPLTVEYEEKFYAAGQILGSRFVRREGRPSDEAMLSGRVVDRTIRPLFPQHMRNDVQVVITVLGVDEYDPDVLGVVAASLALGTSKIPWNGPVSGVRIGKESDNENFLINPSYITRSGSKYNLDITACGKDGNINMIEVGSKEVSEEIIAQGLNKASEIIEKLQEFQKKIIAEIGKEKIFVPVPEIGAEIKEFFQNKFKEKLGSLVLKGEGSKDALNAIREEWFSSIAENLPDSDKSRADDFWDEAVNEVIHKEAIENARRADGRALDQVRPLYAEAGGITPAVHGSGTFFRGETHVVSFLTLGGPQDSLLLDTMEDREVKKRFMHHYNFPPFSVGETGRVGGLNRRAIGHGALAEKALEAVIPDIEKFPYTIRLVSECMASNGSTSMASVCASSVALMDGGVPIIRPVAGISIGLMLEDKNRYALLTDIQGPEDHHGDMDFKVAGTREGVTAIQLDIKLDGVPIPILIEAMKKAKTARIFILDTIEKVIPAPRAEMSPRAPQIVVTKIRPDQIGLVIGGGGKTINEIREKTGTEIEIEENGTVFITGKAGGAEKAAEIIRDMTKEYKAGEVYDGVVTRIMDFGAFVKIGHSAEGLVHISEIAPFRVNRVADVLSEGEQVPVMIKEVDEKGRINLSIKNRDKGFAERKGLKPPSGE